MHQHYGKWNEAESNYRRTNRWAQRGSSALLFQSRCKRSSGATGMISEKHISLPFNQTARDEDKTFEVKVILSKKCFMASFVQPYNSRYPDLLTIINKQTMTIRLSTIISIRVYPRLQMLILKQPQSLQQCWKHTTGLIFDDLFPAWSFVPTPTISPTCLLDRL